jgi:hypothetical protein
MVWHSKFNSSYWCCVEVVCLLENFVNFSSMRSEIQSSIFFFVRSIAVPSTIVYLSAKWSTLLHLISKLNMCYLSIRR